MRPLVSICIPNYNCGKYIAKSIQSALNQSYKNIEIIVVDNNSTDNSWKIIKSVKNKKVLSYRNKHNFGYTFNLNKSVKYAKGKYIKILHADDILEKDVVKKQVDIMEKNKNVGFVYGAVNLINEDEKSIGVSDVHDRNMIIPGRIKLTKLLNGNSVMFPSVMIRKKCVEEVGLFDYEIPYCNDWYMWMRLCLKYDAAYLKDTTVSYRVYESSGGYQYNIIKVSSIEELRCFDKIFELISDKKILRKKNYYYYLLARGQFVRGLQLTIKGKSEHARKYIATVPLIHNNWKLMFSFPFFYLLTYTGKYPSKLLLKIGKILFR